MFSISIISPIQDSPSASQTLIDSTLLLPVAGTHNLPHFLEAGRCVSQANWFDQVKWFAQGQTRSWSQKISVFWRSDSFQLGFGCGRMGAAIAQSWEWGPCSCSLQINLVDLCCPANEAGNRNKPHGCTSVVKPAEFGCSLVILTETGNNFVWFFDFLFSFFFFSSKSLGI